MKLRLRLFACGVGLAIFLLSLLCVLLPWDALLLLSAVAHGNQQQLPGRHLLMTSHHTPSPQTPATQHISYFKLEGVDSTGHDMFMVYGSSIEQMKAICSAVSECEGFNSEGWVKAGITRKERASLDLYLKQVVLSMPGKVTVDTSAGVFQSVLEDYSQMEHTLKIFIYPTDVGLHMPSYQDYKYGVEHLFISLLSNSKFRTNDPSKATFFLLPARCTAYRKSVSDLQQGTKVAGETMLKMVEDIRHRYPYWNASLGTDHFYVCAHDIGTDMARLADHNLWKNAIGLVNTADASEPSFVPHKDISIPPHPGRGVINWPRLGEGGAGFEAAYRRKLAFMAGEESRGIRPLLYRLFKEDSDFHLVNGHIPEKEYLHALKTSKFCLCVRGNKAWSPRLMDALWFGCIPVLIASHYVPPIPELIEWENIAIVVPESQVKQLKAILLSISDQRQELLRLNIQRVYLHLTWNNPPHPYDAFHSTLYLLWRKRNVFRTRSRDL